MIELQAGTIVQRNGSMNHISTLCGTPVAVGTRGVVLDRAENYEILSVDFGGSFYIVRWEGQDEPQPWSDKYFEVAPDQKMTVVHDHEWWKSIKGWRCFDDDCSAKPKSIAIVELPQTGEFPPECRNGCRLTMLAGIHTLSKDGGDRNPEAYLMARVTHACKNCHRMYQVI